MKRTARQRRTDLLRGAQRVLARGFAAVVAVVVLLGVLRGGASYVYCPGMQMVTDGPCCAGDRHAHDDDVAAAELRSRDCCERHVLARLPSMGAPSAPPHLLAAPLVAVLPAIVADTSAITPDAAVRIDHEGRAGPVAAARHRAELMVSLN